MTHVEGFSVGVVVLNYNNFRETIKCVNSILKQEMVAVTVVIVDNGSANESADVLKNCFASEENVTVLCNDENQGYAKGNNVGIKYLRRNGLTHIIVCNSDVEFSSSRIFTQMLSFNFDRVGTVIPIIKNLDGSTEMRAQCRRKMFLLRIIKSLFIRIYRGQKNDSHGQPTGTGYLPAGVQQEYNAITGSVFLLTPDFFRYYDGLFPKTFLYVEELATLTLVHKAGLYTAIADTDDVIHTGGASTDANLKEGSPRKARMEAESAKQVLGLVLTPRIFIKARYGI